MCPSGSIISTTTTTTTITSLITTTSTTCVFPNGYTVAPSDTAKAYKKGPSKVKFSQATSFCAADQAWLVMPKSADDIDDIAQYDSKNC